jgi:F-type H+-transporting ATPase subunit b
MEILKTFGFNPLLLIAQIVNFVIVILLLKKFLYKSILDTLKKRETTIKEGLAQAEEARKMLEDTNKKEKAVLKKAQEEARKLIQDTKKQRDIILKQAEESAREHATAILTEAKQQITFETKQAQKQLATQMSGLTIEFLQKSIGELFSKEDQELIIKNAVQKIKKRAD